MMGSDHLNLLEQFDRELEVAYRGETYRVRDNGAVWRRARPEGRKRPLDEIWTFGAPSTATGYMQIASEVVHRIVATAFHGEQPSDNRLVRPLVADEMRASGATLTTLPVFAQDRYGRHKRLKCL